MNRRLCTAAICFSLCSAPSYAFLGFGSKSDDDPATDLSSMVTNTLTQTNSASEESPLTSLLTSQLPISNEQAAGGAGALLALANSSLGSDDKSELSSLIPGMSALTGGTSGLMSMVGNIDAVKNVFSTLGLDPGMIAQFAPVIIDYLAKQGATSGLLESVTGLWAE
ncbi:DUF2780 domain-containing protein [Vibrio genomosp. F6]|uniref:DUF2780 domain-containing protein n=1 Tax=Vibrio genomosp. F6 str. FF-238 TaxID=1191298 RepID=A0A1E5CUV7_9VIBR|nr:DUF2780 domain-containing protein [Vibrio genomosp. F6]OEE73690.1 hypothetical protein A130_06730 [Vibrio genomosp. F6 str. FF-238]